MGLERVRVLVTGTSGHVGGAIGAYLHEQGHEVVGISRRLNRRARTMSRALSLNVGAAGAAETIAQAQPRCDAIVHAAAALEGDPLAAALTLTNGLGTQQLLSLAARWEVESFVYLSGVHVIGRPAILPITETHPAWPRSAYHASKLYGEHLVRLVSDEQSGGAILRLTAPVGPGMDKRRILPVFVQRALRGEQLEIAGKGSRGQDYVDARDVASAVETAIERRVAGMLNIASGRCVTNLELARICVELLGSSSAVRLSGGPDPDDGVRWEVSTARAERVIGYRPDHPLEDSIVAFAEAIASGGEDG